MKNKKVFLIPDTEYRDINPVDSGYQECPPDFYYGPSVRTYTIIHYIVSGKGIVRKNGIEYAVTASQCFIIRSGERAFYKADGQEPWTYIWLGFRTSLPLPAAIAAMDVMDARRYENVFLPLLRHSNGEVGLSPFLCSKCWELFSLLMQEPEPSLETDVLRRAKDYIEREYMNEVSIAALADMLHIDRTVLSKAFKKQVGMSPQGYLCDFRLCAACRFIRNGGYTLSQIAAMCGYKDYCNFSRMFTKKFGISPREYAKNLF